MLPLGSGVGQRAQVGAGQSVRAEIQGVQSLCAESEIGQSVRAAARGNQPVRTEVEISQSLRAKTRGFQSVRAAGEARLIGAAASPRRDRARLRVPHCKVERGLRALDTRRRRRTRDAARRLVELLGEFAAGGVTPLGIALGQDTPQTWQQYARKDEAVRRSGDWFFYYHSHDRSLHGEHGHFHVFRRLPGQGYAHLIAIGVDARGLPRRLFTTNRWVTNESWRDARDEIQALERIVAARSPAASPLLGWLRALLAAFTPQIALLLAHRDRRVAAHGGARVFEDRRMHVLSECAVSLETQMTAIDSVFP